MLLSDWRTDQNISLGELARRVGNVTQSHLSKISHGLIWPSADLAHRIQIATDGAVTPNDLHAAWLRENEE